MKKLFIAVVFLAAVLCAANVFAAGVTQSIGVTATIPSTASMTVTVSKIVSSTWTTTSEIAFGSLSWDSVNKMFLPSDGGYYAVDIVVNDTASTWTLTHTRSSLASGLSTLDNNVNVTFCNKTSSSAETTLSKVSYANSDNVAYTNSILTNSWLRIYYGIATGSSDASGVSTIGSGAIAGTYSGTVTLTLS